MAEPKRFDSKTAKPGDRLVWRNRPEWSFTFKGMAHGLVVAKVDDEVRRLIGYGPQDVIARPGEFALPA